MNADEYWRMKAFEVEVEQRTVMQSLRDEVEQLQHRCNELLHERTMMRAATVEDVRRFCVEYQQNQIQQQQQQQQQQVAGISSADSIPIHVLLQFLHQYSGGMVPMTENSRRKRSRETTNNVCVPSTMHTQRLLRRVMARQLGRVREEDTSEEFQQEHGQKYYCPCADAAR